MPQPGPQTLAYFNLADELFYGGAAGGGKTDLLIGLGSTAHRRSIIFRRETKQTEGVEERLIELLIDSPLGAQGKYNGTSKEFYSHNRDGYKIFLGGVKDPGDEKKWNGRPHDLKAFDELVQFSYKQYVYLNIWKRTTIPGQRTRTVGASNPPTDEDGMWVIDYWAPWLSKYYEGKRPAAGELRYFITDDGGRSIEVDPADTVKYKGKLYKPKSRSFIPSSVTDNMYYADGAYEQQLAMLPPELRDKFLGGDFQAGITADPMQLVPREWVELAFKRWRERPDPGTPTEQLGVDVNRGGQDRMYLTPRTGNYYRRQLEVPANLTSSGIVAAQKVAEHMIHPATVAYVDVIGIGSSCYDHLLAIRPARVVSMNGATDSGGQRDRSSLLGFVNARAVWHWRLREALDPVSGDDLAICPDDDLMAELCATRWQLTSRGVKIEEKKDIKSRLGRSPDRADSLVYASNQPTSAGQGLMGLYAEEAAALKPPSDPPNLIRIGSPSNEQ